jgi:xanthine dehydrogenase accessory factor
LGFRTNVFDQREDIFKTWEVTSIETHIGDFFQLIDSLEFTENTYAVIVTPQHEFDEKILLKCAPLPHAYLGMIGSRRKVAEIRKNALDSGLLTDRQLDDVDMPIGIPFAAETPDEIAISIVAKMIDVKNTRKKF